MSDGTQARVAPHRGGKSIRSWTGWCELYAPEDTYTLTQFREWRAEAEAEGEAKEKTRG